MQFGSEDDVDETIFGQKLEVFPSEASELEIVSINFPTSKLANCNAYREHVGVKCLPVVGARKLGP